jgi:hypothetical protein
MCLIYCILCIDGFIDCFIITGEDIKNHAFDVHHVHLNRSFISRMMRRNGYGSRTTTVCIIILHIMCYLSFIVVYFITLIY